jgi:hypothetical protein
MFSGTTLQRVESFPLDQQIVCTHDPFSYGKQDLKVADEPMPLDTPLRLASTAVSHDTPRRYVLFNRTFLLRVCSIEWIVHLTHGVRDARLPSKLRAVTCGWQT